MVTARFNSRVAILHIKPVQSLDAPELALYLTLKQVIWEKTVYLLEKLKIRKRTNR
jgi:hypothetical protein